MLAVQCNAANEARLLPEAELRWDKCPGCQHGSSEGAKHMTWCRLYTQATSATMLPLLRPR